MSALIKITLAYAHCARGGKRDSPVETDPSPSQQSRGSCTIQQGYSRGGGDNTKLDDRID
jgi:hypothetical protein